MTGSARTLGALTAKVQPAIVGATVQVVTRNCSTCGRAQTVCLVITAGWKPAESRVCASCADRLRAGEDHIID